MTETVTNAEAQPTELGALLESWAETPPPSLSVALAEGGVDAEALEDYARTAPTEGVETLRRLLVQAAQSENPDDAALLARLTPVLDPRERAWDRVIKAKNSGEVLTATVTEATKGGVVVDLGVRGFVPASQIGLSVPRNLNQYVGRPLRLRVLEVDRRRQTVILTNRQVEEEQRRDKRRSAIERLEEGQDRTGTVRRITDIGAFVDVGGVDGLLHVSEIAWSRVEHPSQILSVGQKVQVKILRVDPEAGRVSLSMRRLATDPWEEARRKYMSGMTLKVKVTQILPHGAVVQVDADLEGFLPISELANRRVATVEEVLQVDQEVDALLTEFNPRDRRLFFSLKKLEQKRDRQVVDSYQKKARTTGSSERTTLGDLFGHLFEEYQPEPSPTPAPEAPASPAAATAQDESGGVVAAIEADTSTTAAGDETAAAEAIEEAPAAVGALEAEPQEAAVAEEEVALDVTADEAVGAEEPALAEAAADEAVGADEPAFAEATVDEAIGDEAAPTDAPDAKEPVDAVSEAAPEPEPDAAEDDSAAEAGESKQEA